MKTKLLFTVFLFISFYSCNNTNVETYHGNEALTMWQSLPSFGSNTAVYRTSNGYMHWMQVNALTAVKYEYSFKGTPDDREIADVKLKITRNCIVEKEMAIITIIYEKMAKEGNTFPVIDNINELTK